MIHNRRNNTYTDNWCWILNIQEPARKFGHFIILTYFTISWGNKQVACPTVPVKTYLAILKLSWKFIHEQNCLTHNNFVLAPVVANELKVLTQFYSHFCGVWDFWEHINMNKPLATQFSKNENILIDNVLLYCDTKKWFHKIWKRVYYTLWIFICSLPCLLFSLHNNT